MNIQVILQQAFALNVSDVHLTPGSPPAFRRDGALLPAAWKADLDLESQYFQPLHPEDLQDLARQILSSRQLEQLQSQGYLDFAFSLAGAGRLRGNGFIRLGSLALVFRLIPPKVPVLQELGLPRIIQDLAQKPWGLVLVTGPTGSGKSWTLAAMLNAINQNSPYHILTLEDPVEFLHAHQKSIVNQRELGRDFSSFAQALRSALREDPDVILVGEMRDTETMAIALTAAETGHLVLSTLHTSNTAQAIDRMIDVFPPHQQMQVRAQLANCLQGVVAQQLIPLRDQPGRVAACEILVGTGAVRNLIREGKTHQLLNQIQTGGKFGMHAFDTYLKDLYQKGLISQRELQKRVVDPEHLWS